MWKIGKIVLLAVALGTVAQSAISADDLIASEMVDQAREWQQKDRGDLAAVIWRKLLVVNPDHPEALVQLGVIEARAGHLKKAQEFYSRAAKLAKPPVGLNTLLSALGSVKETPADLTPSRPPLKSEPNPSESTKSTDSAGKTTLTKPLTPKTETLLPIVPPQKTEVDGLQLKFSNTMGVAR